MLTQQDTKVRMVALTNLREMCARISGVCHRFNVTKVSRSRVHVEYSNPDEYGRDNPMTVVFPCYPSGFSDDADNPRVVLDILRVLNDHWDGEGWQAFMQLLDSPTVWRSEGGWQTHRQIRAAGRDNRTDLPDTCVVCDLKDVS